MSSKVPPGGKNGREFPEVTDEEEQEIREEYDHFVLRKRQKGGGPKRLHIPKSEDLAVTICDVGVNSLIRKDASVYPPGYFPVCKRCGRLWRERRK